MAEKVPKAPTGLRARGRRMWRELWTVYDFSEAPERVFLLEDACRVADLIDRLQAVVSEADDLRVRGSQGQPVGMPELDSLRHYRALLAQLIKSLGLPDEDDSGNTPQSFSRLGNAARWRK
ncbi:MAG: hypothetical protein JST91_00850 [Actinobacteria bacterium]|nr:hypothetical protein [Actinomycetota bacterium]